MKTYEELIRFLSDEEVSHADKLETLQNRDHLLNSEWQARVDEATSKWVYWKDVYDQVIAERQAVIDAFIRKGWEMGVRAMLAASPLPGVRRAAEKLITKGPPS